MNIGQILSTVRQRSKGASGRIRGALSGLGDLWGRGPGRVWTRIRSLWTNNITSTETIGQTLDRSDKWYQWQLGATERHCTDCARFNGQIHRASDWRAAGIRPQSPDLECGGWNCDCQLVLMPDYEGQGEGRMDYWVGSDGND